MTRKKISLDSLSMTLVSFLTFRLRIILFNLINLTNFNIPNNLNLLALSPATNNNAKESNGIVASRSIEKSPFKYLRPIYFGSMTQEPSSSELMVVRKTAIMSRKKKTSIR